MSSSSGCAGEPLIPALSALAVGVKPYYRNRGPGLHGPSLRVQPFLPGDCFDDRGPPQRDKGAQRTDGKRRRLVQTFP